MSGVGQKRGRVDGEACPELAHHESKVDDQGHGIAPVASVHRTVVVAARPVAVPMMAVPVAAVIVLMACMVVIVGVRGAHEIAYTPISENANGLYDNALNVII